ncbi:MAG: prepilin peptidase [Candidatus Nanoarchaeia archaeon]
MFEFLSSIPLSMMIIFIITLIYFLICSYEDFRKKEVLNYINYSYALIILFMSAILSLYTSDLSYLTLASFGMVVGFLLGSIFFFIGMWGGGDAKFMIGFGGSFALLQDYLFSYVSNVVSLISISESINNWMYLLLLALVGFSVVASLICVGIIMHSLLVKRMNSKELLNSGVLAIVLFAIQVFAIVCTVLFFEQLGIVILSNIIMLISLLVFIMLPQSAVLHFSKQFSLSLKELENNINRGEEYVLIDDLVHKKSIVISLKDSLYGLSQYHIDEIKKHFSSSHTFNVAQVYNLVMLLPLFNFFVFVLSIASSFEFISGSLLFITMLEFMLLSFTIGGVYVFSIIIVHLVFNFKRSLQKLSTIQKISIVTTLLIGGVGFVLFDGIVQYYSGLIAIISLTYTLYVFSKIVENSLFVIPVSIDKLSPGDWIVEDVIVDNKQIYSKDDFLLGVNEEQINVMKKYSKLKNVQVKTGIAFIPHLFAAFIVLLIL